MLPRKLLLLTCLFSVGALADSPVEHDAEAGLTSLKVDISKVAAAGRVQPVDGITTSGQPDVEALQVFSDSGYAAIIDLRRAAEDRGLDEQAAVEETGMRYLPFPLAAPDDINFDSAERLNRLIKEQDGPVLIHCGSGNRVGAMLALIESLEGADDEAAIAAGKEGGLTRLESVVRERLKENEP